MRISDWSSDVCSSDLASLSPTRARAFATRVSTSAARSERLVSDHGDLTQEPQAHLGPRRIASASPGPWSQEDQRHERASAFGRQPIQTGRETCRERRDLDVSNVVVAVLVEPKN